MRLYILVIDITEKTQMNAIIDSSFIEKEGTESGRLARLARLVALRCGRSSPSHRMNDIQYSYSYSYIHFGTIKNIYIAKHTARSQNDSR